jgi:hypothetical protein
MVRVEGGAKTKPMVKKSDGEGKKKQGKGFVEQVKTFSLLIMRLN